MHHTFAFYIDSPYLDARGIMLKALEEKLFRTRFSGRMFSRLFVLIEQCSQIGIVVEPTLLHKRIPKCVFSHRLCRQESRRIMSDALCHRSSGGLKIAIDNCSVAVRQLSRRLEYTPDT